jgi:hypothetical protein
MLRFVPYEDSQRGSDGERGSKEDQIDGNRVVIENLMCNGIEDRLSEVEETSETND